MGQERIEELEILSEAKLDDIGITETLWNSTHYWNTGIQEYVLFRGERNKGQGGRIIYISEEINCKEISD